MAACVFDFGLTLGVCAVLMLVIDLAWISMWKRRTSIAGDLVYAVFDALRALVRRRNRIPRARVVRRV